jgi:hypothetical protein
LTTKAGLDTMDKTIRIIFPPIIGFLIFKICDYIFESIFPIEPIDDLSTPGIVFLMEYIVIIIGIGIVYVIQYYLIVPKTSESIKKIMIVFTLIGVAIGLVFGLGHFFIDKGTLTEAIITFFRLNVQFDSFFLGNIAMIGILNLIKDKRTKTNKA